jgi:Rieske 2Fe-2S family protein
MSQTFNSVIKEYRSGYSLPREVYHDPQIFEEEIRAIFMKSWLYAGHQSQIPKRGDYFLFEMAGESVIVVRAGDGQINALVNVCRHRGSQICDALTGHETRFTCRYHGWTYNLDGSLLAASRMPEGFDKSRHGLYRLHVKVLAGMIFINFDTNPVPFDALERDLAEPLAPYQLDRAKVAHKQNYAIRSNWKLAVENYNECYHCLPAHPEYSVAHGRAVPPSDWGASIEEVMARAPQVGLTQHVVNHSWLDAEALGVEAQFDRYPLFRGYKTGSRDGELLAPFLGSIKGVDGGTTDLHMGPTTFGLAYVDHVVLYRFTPRTISTTDCDITWLVNETAVEGRDYDLAKLTWLWDVTTIADKQIIERNQLGVDSRYYRPGPLSQMEGFHRRLLDWYVARMLEATGSRPAAAVRSQATP